MSRCRGSRTLADAKRQAAEADLHWIRTWCLTAIADLPIPSVKYTAVLPLLDSVRAAEERLGLREPYVGHAPRSE
jgi:hypothetical protein